MVNVWGSKYSSRNQAVRDAEDETLEMELMDRNWQFLPQNEYLKLKRLVENHRLKKVGSEEDLVRLCYDMVGKIV